MTRRPATYCPHLNCSIQEAQVLASTFEQNLAARHPEAASIGGAAAEALFELLNNAPEHGMSADAGHCHVQMMPHSTGQCLDIVVVDSGPGIRAAMAQNPDLPFAVSD